MSFQAHGPFLYVLLMHLNYPTTVLSHRELACKVGSMTVFLWFFFFLLLK